MDLLYLCIQDVSKALSVNADTGIREDSLIKDLFPLYVHTKELEQCS